MPNTTTINPSHAAQEAIFIQSVASCLGESNTFAIQIMVRALGHQRVMQLLQETLRIEESGGQMVKDGSRRRTPGGIFFALARSKYNAELPVQLQNKKKFFSRKEAKAHKAAKQAASTDKV